MSLSENVFSYLKGLSKNMSIDRRSVGAYLPTLRTSSSWGTMVAPAKQAKHRWPHIFVIICTAQKPLQEQSQRAHHMPYSYRKEKNIYIIQWVFFAFAPCLDDKFTPLTLWKI